MVLAVPEDAWDGVLTSELGRILLEDYALTVLVFDPAKEVILRWYRLANTPRS
jgi:hypothetical protein